MKISKKIASLAIAGAVIASALVGAQAAQAAAITGTVTVTPTSGNVNTDTYFLNSVAVSTGAPVGFRNLSGTFVFQNGVNLGAVSSARTLSMPATAGTSGLDGNPAYMDRSISPTNNFVTNKLLNALPLGALATGQFELRYYYFASTTSPDVTTDPYVKLDMTFDAASGAWSVYTAPPAATATTTSLTAQATGSAVALSATIKVNGTVSTAAAGNVIFKEGTTTVATVPVASGVASASLSGVADGQHVYTAEFQPKNAGYLASTSAPATVQVGGVQSTITTTIPSGANGGVLTLTGVTPTVALGTATFANGTLNAQGTLTSVVTDSRALDFPAWSLTGQVGDFKTTDGTKTIEGKYLGWTPAVAGTASGSVAGSVIAPAPVENEGLKVIRTLATGKPNTAGDVTNASALLQLKAPAKTPAGDYSATLTLTLI